jgi:hypothetical protein
MSARLPVVMRRGLPLVLPRGYRQDPAYQQLRQALTATRTFAEVIRQLEQAVIQVPQIAVDLLPQEAWAQRFIYTIGREAVRPQPTPRQRRLVTRSVQVLLRLLLGTRRRRTGRRPAPPPSAREARPVTETHQDWHGQLQGCRLADREDLRCRIRNVARDRWGLWGPPQDRQLARLVRKPRLRPSDLLPQLVAWELGLSVRRVRRVLTTPVPDIVHQ